MVFSKRERELLEHIKKDDWVWFNQRYARFYKPDVKKFDYYRKLISRIEKKVIKMNKDLELFKEIKSKENYPFYNKGHQFRSDSKAK